MPLVFLTFIQIPSNRHCILFIGKCILNLFSINFILFITYVLIFLKSHHSFVSHLQWHFILFLFITIEKCLFLFLFLLRISNPNQNVNVNVNVLNLETLDRPSIPSMGNFLHKSKLRHERKIRKKKKMKKKANGNCGMNEKTFVRYIVSKQKQRPQSSH